MKNNERENIFKNTNTSILKNKKIILGKPDNEDFINMGFQGGALGQAVNIFNQSLKKKSNIALAFTSNAITCGVRQYITKFIREYNVTMVITSAGALEEDLLKTFNNFLQAPKEFSDSNLRKNGLNRSYDILVPNSYYSELSNFFEKFILDKDLKNKTFTITDFCNYAGSIIKDENSFIRICYKKKIPIYIQGALDGSIGDIIYFLNKNYKLTQDNTYDYLQSCDQATKENNKKKLLLILGGSTPKHYCCNIHLLAGGADYAIYLNTELVQDGSNAGASPSEAISWGKIKSKSKIIKVFCDFSISFPLFSFLIKENLQNI